MDRRTFITTTLSSAAAITAVGFAPAIAGGHGRVGKFSGLSDHITTGGGELTHKEVILLDDFEFDGAPDPRVGLGKDGKYDESTDLGELRENAGKQVYTLPEGLKAEDYNEIYIWCKKFAVPLGVAKL